MTDTLNGPREKIARIIDPFPFLFSDEHGKGEAAKLQHDALEKADRIIALLAAAPKAEPVVSCKNCGTVRGATNECDCSRHDGSVPEWEAVHPEAPKVEQEPVAYVSRKGFTTGGLVWTKEGMDANLPDETKLYSHPAPASDELLEALVAVCEAIRVWRTPPFGYDFITSAEAAYHALVVAKATIAKHKGPQS